MNPKKLLLRKLTAAILVFFAFACSNESKLEVDINWEAFLSKQDMVWDSLEYSEKPDYWEQRNMKHHHGWHEGAFTGNGEIGAMIYKESPETLRFQLGRYDVNSHRQVAKIDWTVPRLLIGDFLMSPKGEILHESMRLSLWNAEVSGTLETDKGSIEWRSITHAEDMTIMVELKTSGEESATQLAWRPESGISPRWWYSPDSATVKVEMPPKAELKKIEGINVSVQKFVGTGEYAIAWKEKVISDQHKIYYISIENSHPENTARQAAVDHVLMSEEKPVDSYVDEHRTFWHNYYPQSFVSLPDKKWEAYYWIQMYKLASATRADGEIIDNSGPWLPLSPWPGVWWNLNVQLSYSPLYTSNRLNIAGSLMNQVHDRREVFRTNNIPDSLLGKDCALLDRCSDLSFKTNSKFLELGNLTWVLQTLWRHYRHSMDEELLREKIYPLLRSNINSYLHLMYPGEDGKLHLPPSHSPEYGRDLQTRDANYALALFRWGCQALIEANRILEIEDELLPKWEYVLENLVEAPVDENGLMVGADIPFAMSHRHFSHLFPIYPLHQLDHTDSADRALINTSIDHWIGFEGALAAYSYTAASSMMSSMGNGDRALEYLEGFLPYICPNTMYVEAGQVIETPLSCAESIQDMLLQSWGDKIRVFPAISSKWENASFDKLLAEGGFEVSAVRKNGKTQFVKVRSLAGEPLVLVPNIDGPVKIIGNRDFEITQIQSGLYSIDLQEGEEIILFAENVNEFIIAPVSGDARDHNYFGPKDRKKAEKQLHNPE